MPVVLTCASCRSRGWWKAQACVLLVLIHEVSADPPDLSRACFIGLCRACWECALDTLFGVRYVKLESVVSYWQECSAISKIARRDAPAGGIGVDAGGEMWDGKLVNLRLMEPMGLMRMMAASVCDQVWSTASSACVVLVVGLGLVFLQEVFEVVLHRVSEGHTVEFRGAVEVQACIVGAVVVQGRRLLGLIGCP